MKSISRTAGRQIMGWLAKGDDLLTALERRFDQETGLFLWPAL